MANIVDVTTLLDGPRHAIVQVYLQSDGSGNELEDHVLLDPVNDFGLTSDQRFSVEEILFNFTGFDATIQFDTGVITKNVIWVLPEGASNYVDFRPFGGFKDRSELDGTGKLQMNTLGFTSVNSFGSMVLKIRKGL